MFGNSSSQSESGSVDRRRFVKTVGAAGIAGLAGCGGIAGNQTTDGAGSQTIPFGQPAIITGGLSFIQPPVSASSDIARDMINEAGGPLGREIELVRRDTGYDPSTAEGAVRELVDDGAVVLNGLTSTTSVPNWEVIQELEIPVVSMYAGTRFYDTRGGDNGTPGDLGDDEWFWRTTGADSQHTAAAAIHAKNSGATRIGVINTKTSGARTWAEAFYDAVAAIDGLEQVNRLEVEGGRSSYSEQLETFFADDLDLFAVAVEEAPDAVTLFDEWEAGGYGGKVLLSNPMKNSEIRKKLGGKLDDHWARVSVPAIAGPYAQTYLDKFESFVGESDDYAEDLSVNNWSASAYDAITVTALAIERAGEATPEAIERNLGPVSRRPGPGREVSTFAEGKQALEEGKEISFVGAQTSVEFTDKGDVFNAARVWELGADSWSEVSLIAAAEIRNVVRKVTEETETTTTAPTTTTAGSGY